MFLLFKGRLLKANLEFEEIIRVITNDWHKKKREQTYYACPGLLCEALCDAMTTQQEGPIRDAGDLDLIPSIHMAPHNHLQLTPVSRDLTLSSGLCRRQAHIWYINIHVGKTHMHIKKGRKTSFCVSKLEDFSRNIMIKQCFKTLQR